MTAADLRQYFTAWCDSRAEVIRLGALPPSPAVDAAYARAQADEEYDRAIYKRLRTGRGQKVLVALSPLAPRTQKHLGAGFGQQARFMVPFVYL